MLFMKSLIWNASLICCVLLRVFDKKLDKLCNGDWLHENMSLNDNITTSELLRSSWSV